MGSEEAMENHWKLWGQKYPSHHTKIAQKFRTINPQAAEFHSINPQAAAKRGKAALNKPVVGTDDWSPPPKRYHTYTDNSGGSVLVPEGMDPHLVDPNFSKNWRAALPTQSPTIGVVTSPLKQTSLEKVWAKHWKQWGELKSENKLSTTPGRASLKAGN
jgi:hypothetical protein